MDGIPYTLQATSSLPLQNCPFPWGIWTLMVPSVHQVQKHKGHLGRFSHFAGLTTVTDRHRPTDIPRYSICINKPRPHLRIVLWRGLIIPMLQIYEWVWRWKNAKIGQHMVKLPLRTRVWWQTFFDSQCSIQTLIKVRQYNYVLLNSVVMFLWRHFHQL